MVVKHSISKPVVVIGSGLAGYMFVKEFRQLESSRPLIMITKSDGRFYSKPLLSTALTHKKSIDALSIDDAKTMAEKMSVDIITHANVTNISPDKKIVVYRDAHGEHQLEYGDLVLACGADKIALPLTDEALSDVHSVNDIEDYEKVRDWLQNKKHIGIIGAGFVGCEFANDLINSDYQVTVITADAYPLARLMPEKIGRILQTALEQKGVQWVTDHIVKHIDRDSQGYQMILNDDDVIHVDGVMSAVGIQPHLILAKSAGIKTCRGVVVDSHLRSSDPNIYALGDCAEINGEIMQYVAPIIQSARVLAIVLVQQEASLDFPIMPIIVKTPACPIIAVLPKKNFEGKWCYEGEGSDWKALFYDHDYHLCGFALTGKATREKMVLVKQLESRVNKESQID